MTQHSHSSSISPTLPPPANSSVSPTFDHRHDYASWSQDAMSCSTERRDMRHNYSNSRVPVQSFSVPSFAAAVHSAGGYDTSTRRSRGLYSPRLRDQSANVGRHHAIVDHGYTLPHFNDAPREIMPFETVQESSHASRNERPNGNDRTGHQYRPPPNQVPITEGPFNYGHSGHMGYQGYEGYRG